MQYKTPYQGVRPENHGQEPGGSGRQPGGSVLMLANQQKVPIILLHAENSIHLAEVAEILGHKLAMGTPCILTCWTCLGS